MAYKELQSTLRASCLTAMTKKDFGDTLTEGSGHRLEPGPAQFPGLKAAHRSCH